MSTCDARWLFEAQRGSQRAPGDLDRRVTAIRRVGRRTGLRWGGTRGIASYVWPRSIGERATACCQGFALCHGAAATNGCRRKRGRGAWLGSCCYWRGGSEVWLGQRCTRFGTPLRPTFMWTRQPRFTSTIGGRVRTRTATVEAMCITCRTRMGRLVRTPTRGRMLSYCARHLGRPNAMLTARMRAHAL